MNKQHYNIIKRGYKKGMYDGEIASFVIGKTTGKPVSRQYIKQFATRNGFVKGERHKNKILKL